MRPLIFLEFNELSSPLMDRFISEGRLPNFARLRSQSAVYVTEAVERPPALEPWIQWVTVHTGLDHADHGIFNLNEGHKLRHKCVWDLLSDAGFRVLVFGSMNVRYDLPINGWVLPDPWTTSVLPHPEDLQPFFRFVQAQVQEHTRGASTLSAADYGRFGSFMASHGLSVGTASAIVGQLVREAGGKNGWRRTAILDRLQFDVFSWYYRHYRPHFATFFLNSTAHFQHMYWRNLEPELFTVQPSPEEQVEFSSAILFGYQEMDRVVGRFFDLAGDAATLVLCTALSQQPCLTYEGTGGKVAYRPRNFEALLRFAGVPGRFRVSPVMAEEFHVYFEGAEDVRRAERALMALRLAERPLVRVREQEAGLLLGCNIFEVVQPGALVTREGGETAPFYDLFYRIEGLKSGMHHPDGILWIREPERSHHVEAHKIPLSAIAPTILSHFGVEPPSFMRTPCLRAAESP